MRTAEGAERQLGQATSDLHAVPVHFHLIETPLYTGIEPSDLFHIPSVSLTITSKPSSRTLRSPS